MGIFSTLSAANAVRKTAKALWSEIGVAGVVKVLDRVTAVEADYISPLTNNETVNKGVAKMQAVLDWFQAAFPKYVSQVALVRAFVDTLVKLFNVIGLFRKPE